jgi:hypothetical protein
MNSPVAGPRHAGRILKMRISVTRVDIDLRFQLQYDGSCIARKLPDNRSLAGGGGRPKPEVEPAMGMRAPADAMVAVLTEDVVADESFAKGGFKLYDLGGNDFFWAGALSPDGKHVVMAGIAGGAVVGHDDDNAALLLLPVAE